MSKIKNAFKNKKAFIGFLTAGDPNADKTVEYILAMAETGADIIEIGIPFSDPTAEGSVIQAANLRALQGGMSTEKVFGIVERVRVKSGVPLVFLTYINPVFKYGYERFFSRCERLGVDGIIIPDLPYEEKSEISDIAAAYGVDIIPLIAPTSENRIQSIAMAASGYIYIVSSMGVTGVRSEIKTDIKTIVQTVKAVSHVPVAVGFGISTPEQAKNISSVADGVIVGSAIVRIIEQHGENASDALKDYVREMKKAMD